LRDLVARAARGAAGRHGADPGAVGLVPGRPGADLARLAEDMANRETRMPLTVVVLEFRSGRWPLACAPRSPALAPRVHRRATAVARARTPHHVLPMTDLGPKVKERMEIRQVQHQGASDRLRADMAARDTDAAKRDKDNPRLQVALFAVPIGAIGVATAIPGILIRRPAP